MFLGRDEMVQRLFDVEVVPVGDEIMSFAIQEGTVCNVCAVIPVWSSTGRHSVPHPRYHPRRACIIANTVPNVLKSLSTSHHA